jgi:7,8-dihydropterin-6-yl-methyl-4-(beta-D-ribofuranosyl)aminobenzene 5'-phosphate synthase
MSDDEQGPQTKTTRIREETKTSLDFGEGVDKVKITVLTNNTTDMLQQTDPQFKGRVVQPMKKTANAIAEHGLAMSIETNGAIILYDFGGLGFAILKNFQVLNVNPKIFHKTVLSHGHFDHFGSFMKTLPLLGPDKEIIVSPDAYKQEIAYLGEPDEIIDASALKQNYEVLKKANKIDELPPLSKPLLQKLVADNKQTLVETRTPLKLAPSVWTSGEIQLVDKSEMTPNFFLKVDKMTFGEETFRHEMAIYIKVKHKGLVVLTGCGHTGIINTIKQGQKLSGIDRIYAVVGGFHLEGSSDEHMEKVLDYFNKISPDIICGMHCTGFDFNTKLLSGMPDKATLGVVGTTFNL